MYLKRLELAGFKSFAKKSLFEFNVPITAVVGPNGSGKSNVAEAFRFVLGEQSLKSMRGKRGEDLIFNGSKALGRLNRASVAIVFDNTKKVFPFDYEEVSLSREVYRDGVNHYSINGTQVRLKDVVELLASAHIGSSAHHIISQGESDRILSATLRDRRVMIEDALGLRIYQLRKHESLRKLEKTEENLDRVRSLRKEIEPHLRFLKKQVEKIERSKELRRELTDLLKTYFKKEEIYIEQAFRNIAEEKADPDRRLLELNDSIGKIEEALSASTDTRMDGRTQEIGRKLESIRERKDEVSRSMGRVEGMLELETRRIERIKNEQHAEDRLPDVSFEKVREWMEEVRGALDGALSLDEIHLIKEKLTLLRQRLESFEGEYGHEKKEAVVPDESERVRLEEEQRACENRMNELREEEKMAQMEYENIRKAMDDERSTFRDTEKELFGKITERNEVVSRLHALSMRQRDIEREKKEFEDDLSSAAFSVGREVLSYPDTVLDSQEYEKSREDQRELKKRTERMKIKLEELGGSGEDVINEHREVSERDEFLKREVSDLEASAESLRGLIGELDGKLTDEFKDGVRKINEGFQEFFSLLFGGGTAKLNIVVDKTRKRPVSDVSDSVLSLDVDDSTENEAQEQGIDIDVSLPHKRLRGIQMLSGGERSLTSVALLFALSQVNPPPFLVLDETDAALDEANSRKYGNMLEALSKRSQLIVITHNRETMSHAGALFGITAGADAVSRVLSVQFEEAVKGAAR